MKRFMIVLLISGFTAEATAQRTFEKLDPPHLLYATISDFPPSPIRDDLYLQELSYNFYIPPEKCSIGLLEEYIDKDGEYTYRTDFLGMRLVDPGDDLIQKSTIGTPLEKWKR